MLLSKTQQAHTLAHPQSAIDKKVSQLDNVDYDALGLGLRQEEIRNNKKVEVNDFMRLFITQMQNQDPLSSEQKGHEFLGQLAQFSAVEGLSNVETSIGRVLESLDNAKALQVATMLGKSVEAETSRIRLYDGHTHVQGSIGIPEGIESMQVTFSNDLGEVIKAFDVETAGLMPGPFPFEWNGCDQEGERLPTGDYRITVEARVNGKAERLNTHVFTAVESIAVNKETGAYELNLANADTMNLSEVSQIQ